MQAHLRNVYRKHPWARALQEVRPEIVRLILTKIGDRGIVASGVRQLTGMPFTDDDLLRLRDRDCRDWSDNRLLLRGERLGLRAKVTFH